MKLSQITLFVFSLVALAVAAPAEVVERGSDGYGGGGPVWKRENVNVQRSSPGNGGGGGGPVWKRDSIEERSSPINGGTSVWRREDSA